MKHNKKDKNVRWLKQFQNNNMSFRLSIYSLRRIKIECKRVKNIYKKGEIKMSRKTMAKY